MFPRIITRYSTCRGRDFEALFAIKSHLILPPLAGLTGDFLCENYYFPSQTSRGPAAYHSKLSQPRVTCTQALAGMSPQRLDEQLSRVCISSTTILMIAKDALAVEGCLLASLGEKF